MAPCSENDHRNGVVSSLPTTEEPTSTGTDLDRNPTTLPFELVEEILCRLPVKLLLQLQCLCKSWKSLISNRKFAKKHLQMSQVCQQHHHLLLSTRSQSGEPLWHSPIPSFFNNLSNSTITLIQLNCPIYGNYLEVFSCDGILCLTSNADFAVLWNPSIRRFNRLPPLETQWENNSYSFEEVRCLYSFGYDHANDVYKVVTAQKK
ncbi:hypothetical protein RYX36_014179 [Vicia faba]